MAQEGLKVSAECLYDMKRHDDEWLVCVRVLSACRTRRQATLCCDGRLNPPSGMIRKEFLLQQATTLLKMAKVTRDRRGKPH